MLKHIKFNDLGKANHGWLKANHHFSFAHYYNPARMGFGTLRVVNDDWVAAGKGFDPHPHRNMEIITFVRSGEISHQDNAGHTGVTKAGEVQVMSAGSGIIHSEYNLSEQDLTLFQIWIQTNKHNVNPRWESKPFNQGFSDQQLPLLVSGYSGDHNVIENKPLFIHQHARIYAGKITKGTQLTQPITHQAYVLASQGEFKIIELPLTDSATEHTENKADLQAQVTLQKGDAAEITQTQSIMLEALADSEIVIIDAP
ncbi:pirin family protein [Algibacillus agarilyticus]|uniref:pirin family protein n=1 Tax=Algibacillus agarilyticus TaxID=2234133 RepID=UPI000DD0D2B9|nr:pirin-like bicupin family protein [Algibacillus agarilyticus]